MRAAALVAITLLLATAAAAEPLDDEASYEFLERQGQLLFDYGKFDEAADAFGAACATPQGAADFECWRKLATSAEQAGRIGVAQDAWVAAYELGGAEAPAANREWRRLRIAFGAVVLELPPGREFPTAPGALVHTGLLIDPASKAHVAAIVAQAAEFGFESAALWLPPGAYTFGGVPFEVESGQETVLELPARLVPWRSAAFRAPDSAGLSSEGGPWSLGIDFELAVGGAPGGGLGLSPVGLGGQARIGRRLGPVRIEARGRLGGTPTSSTVGPQERDGTAWHILGQFDVGLDLAPASALRLTPHAGFVGGTLGAMLVRCRTESPDDARVYDGDCRLGSLAAGGQAGIDLLLIPPTPLGRIAIRIGFFGEALAGGLLAVPGRALTGDLRVVIVKLERWRFVVLRGGLDVGISLRF